MQSRQRAYVAAQTIQAAFRAYVVRLQRWLPMNTRVDPIKRRLSNESDIARSVQQPRFRSITASIESIQSEMRLRASSSSTIAIAPAKGLVTRAVDFYSWLRLALGCSRSRRRSLDRHVHEDAVGRPLLTSREQRAARTILKFMMEVRLQTTYFCPNTHVCVCVAPREWAGCVW